MSSESTFGQNDWLVDEMFQQYKEDPSSVDEEWREMFDKQGHSGASQTTPLVSPATKQASVRDTQQHQSRTATKVAESTGAPSQDGRATRVDAAVKDVPHPSAKQAGKKKAKQSPMERLQPLPEAGEKQLKGTFKAIAKNMDESLTVPTATTVRDMPVKLMFENLSLIHI